MIDQYVFEKRYYSTRADFVQSGVRQLIYTYAQKKRDVMEQLNTEVTKDAIEEIFTSITKIYLESFEKLHGKSTQINFRIPEGLDIQTDLLLRCEYGYRKKADFPRAGIMCLLAHLNEVEDILMNTEKFMIEQQKLREQIYQVVMEGMKNNLSGQEIISDALRTLTPDSGNEKKRGNTDET